MSGRKLQVFDKKDLECPVCLERFKEPKVLYCIHSYCLHCLQNLLGTTGTIKCPKCCQVYGDLKKEDLQNLPPNEKISRLVRYVDKIESEKPANCSSCDNQPQYYCSDCEHYLCGQCIKQHKILPVLKDHSLYRLDIADEWRNDQNCCQIHCENFVEFFCQTCYKRGCKKCEHVVYCYQDQHNVIKIKAAVDKFNQNASDIINTIQEIKRKLKQTFSSIANDRSNFESQLKLCRRAIEIKEQVIIMKVQEKTKALMTDLEEIYKDKMQIVDTQVENIDSKLAEVNEIFILIKAMMNNPEETEALRSHEATVTAVKDLVFGDEFEKLVNKKSITPQFIPFIELGNLVDINGIGRITNADCIYEIAKDDMSITVTAGQSFTVKVSSLTESETHQLAATLVNTSGEESATEIEDHGNGEYRIKGRCNVESNWQMKITAGPAHIKGSPVNVKVEKIGLVQTIGNISKYKEYEKQNKVTDVMLSKDGCMLVSSYSKELLKFNQSGSFVRRILVAQDVRINRMHRMSNGHVVYSDNAEKRIVMCNDKFKEIRSFGQGILKYPSGLTVNEATRILYAADGENHCVFKFDVDDGSLLGKIGSKGSGLGQLSVPDGVTVTKDGYVVVVDCGNFRIQMFDMNDKAVRILVGSGQDDGFVVGPHHVTIDAEENMLISSNHKLQLFDKNGVFIKQIGNRNDDGLEIPAGNAVISNRPRRVAVASHRANNIKIFNY